MVAYLLGLYHKLLIFYICVLGPIFMIFALILTYLSQLTSILASRPRADKITTFGASPRLRYQFSRSHLIDETRDGTPTCKPLLHMSTSIPFEERRLLHTYLLYISTSVWVQHPNAGRNIQHIMIFCFRRALVSKIH